MKGTSRGISRLMAVALLASAGAAPVAAQPLFEDTFDSLGDGSRPSEQSWLIAGATDDAYWYGEKGSLSTGNLDNTKNPQNLVFVRTANARRWTDVTVRASFRMEQRAGSILLAVRQQDDKNYYLARLTSAIDGTGNVRRVAEILTMQGALLLPLAAKGERASETLVVARAFEMSGQNHDIEFSAQGNRLTLRLDGTELVTAVDNNNIFREGSVGVGAAENQVVFDRVLVEGAAAAAGAGEVKSGGWRILVAEMTAPESEAPAIKELTDQIPPTYTAAVIAEGNRRMLAVTGISKKDEAETLAKKLLDDGWYDTKVVEAPAAANSLYQAVLAEYPTEAAAQQAKEAAVADQGFLPNSLLVTPGGAGFQLLMEKPQEARAAAEKIVADMKSDFPDAKVIEIAEAGGAGRNLSNLSDAERRKAEELINKLSGENLSPEEARRIDEEAKSTSSAVQEVLRREQERKRYSSDADRARKAGKWAEAEGALLQWKSLDPDNPLIDSLLAETRREANKARTTPTPTPQPALSLDEKQKLREENARAAEAKGDAATDVAEKIKQYDEAMRLWKDIGSETNVTSELKKMAGDEFLRVSSKNSDLRSGSAPASEEKSGLPWGLIGGAVGGLVLLGGAAFFLLGRKKSAPAPQAISKAQAAITPLPVSPLPTAAITPLPTSVAAPPPHAAPPIAPSTPGGVAMPPVGTTPERILPGAYSPAPGAGGPPPPAVKPSDSFAHIPGVVTPPLAGPGTPIPTPVPASDHPRSTPEMATPQRISPTDLPTGPSSGEYSVPDMTPPLNPTPPSGVAVPAQTSSDEFYTQSFDNEAVGSTPKGWRGTYDYAKLTVVKSPRGDGNCMRFDKKSGSGSAYYACRFPDASGKIVVEYDLCCEDKNKYLLGFYIEKDEDFRHSIHTVVHRDSGKGEKITLRLQNESSPYELGGWVHVKFLIDLTRHLVDGYVDDKPVAIGVRLVSRPKVINTLSIRDNLLTEGVMMIDNLKIYRDR